MMMMMVMVMIINDDNNVFIPSLLFGSSFQLSVVPLFSDIEVTSG